MVLKPAKKVASAWLIWVDRFGEHENPISKGVLTGFLSLIVYAFVITYGIVQYINFKNMPPTQNSDVLWAAMDGPFPLPLRCAAERCWVSGRYSMEAGAGCVGGLAEGSGSQCHELRRGEHITLQTCYSSLPSTGLRLHFNGSTAWETLLPGAGLSDAQDGLSCGWWANSDSLMETTGGVIDMPTPICKGMASMYHVRTLNGTFKSGEVGHRRYEWFTKQLSTQAPASNFWNDPCQSVLTDGSVKSTVLRMDPDFTQIKVAMPPSFVSTLIGIIGGALASCDEVIGGVIFIGLSTMSIKHFFLPGAPEIADKVDVEVPKVAQSLNVHNKGEATVSNWRLKMNG